MLEDYAQLSRAIIFRKPQLNTAHAAWLAHIPFAFWVIDVLRPRVLVELGTYTGVSYCAFCQAVAELKLQTDSFAVDTWQGDPQCGYYGEEIYNKFTAYHNPRYAGFSTLLRSSFDEALQHFADASVDLLHIDGHHTYEAVKHDFHAWLPKLSSRGIVLFHDTNVHGGDFGVWSLWREVAQRYPHFEFMHGYGLGVLAVGQDLPEPLRWLTRDRTCVPHEAAEIREFFSRLGQLVCNEARVEAVLSSASWRITAPLHRFERILLRFFSRS